MSRGQILRTMPFQGASACAMGSQAWARETPQKADSSTIEDVVVTDRRAAVESAHEHKKHAKIIVDSLVAGDAGGLRPSF